MSLEILLSFLLACIIIELTPGPNMMYLVLLSSLKGRKAGLSMVAGISLGLLTIGLIAAYGAAIFIANNPALYQAIRWAGVLYMMWLAWDAWPRKKQIPEVADSFDARYFRRGLITNILNPKAVLFYVTVFPTFMESGRDTLHQSIVLTVIYVSVATLIHGTLALLGGGISSLLQETKRAEKIQKIFSALLFLIALWFAWSSHLS